jgi:plastocyanin
MARLNRAPLAPLALLFGAVLLGCGGDGGNGGNGGTPPATMAIAKASSNSGDAQTGTVGQPLATPLQVVVTENGTSASGETVTWSTTALNASLTASSTTDANGIASSAWTLGTVSGSQTAQASLSGASGSPVIFTATAVAGAAVTIANAGGDNQVGEISTQLASPVQAKVSDQLGNGVAGVAVNWAASGGTVSGATVATNPAGISAVNVTLSGVAGPVTITAAADGLGGSPLTFNATATEPAPIPTTGAVTVGNDFFQSDRNNTSPAVDTVAIGGTVTWTWFNTGVIQHSVRSTGSPSFTSSTIKTAPANHSFAFMTAGTYQYDCAVHGAAMTGRVVVR